MGCQPNAACVIMLSLCQCLTITIARISASRIISSTAVPCASMIKSLIFAPGLLMSSHLTAASSTTNCKVRAQNQRLCGAWDTCEAAQWQSMNSQT
jgi:hypothetical protein